MTACGSPTSNYNILTDIDIQSMIHRMNLTAILEELVHLSAAKQIREIEARWATKSEERINAVDRGELQTVDGPSALLNLRSVLTK